MNDQDLFETWEIEERCRLLSAYIRERNEREGLDTPEKRLAALGQRMKQAKAAENERVLRERREVA